VFAVTDPDLPRYCYLGTGRGPQRTIFSSASSTAAAGNGAGSRIVSKYDAELGKLV
jgi:hypothetical protein